MSESGEDLTLESGDPRAASSDIGDSLLADADSEYGGSHWVDLPSGKHLIPKEASDLARSELTRLVVLAGPVKSGKTTLISSIYERFQRGTFGGYSFAGSRTLIAFERICHKSRIPSELAKPDTDRTRPTDHTQFLHLRLRPSNLTTDFRTILFADISGEDFRAACRSTEDCKRMEIVKRADHFVILVDGEKLIDLDRRQQVRNEALLLLRSFLESRMLDSNANVQILFSKLDLLSAAAEAQLFVDRICADFVGQHGSQVGNMRFFRIAARSKQFLIGHNVDQVLPIWLERSRPFGLREEGSIIAPTLSCEFDRYQSRILSGDQS